MCSMLCRYCFFVLCVVSIATALSSSPWSPAYWRLTLNIGREPNAEMPKSWGASGGRLVLGVNVKVDSTDATHQDDFLGNQGGGAMLLQPLEQATFITRDGQQTVQIDQHGGWNLVLPRGGTRGHMALLQCWIQTKTKAVRNDILLKPQRLYLTANCWRRPELQRGQALMEPIYRNFQKAQDKLNQQLSHETGDRRLNGTEPLETMLAYKDMAWLVQDLNSKQSQLREAQAYLPPCNMELSSGPWPGATEPLFVYPQELLIKESKLWGDEYHTVGTWQIKAIPPPNETQ